MARQVADNTKFRIIAYNVLEGFRTFPERHPQVLQWLADQQPDVVALEELNEYTEDRLRLEAARWGHPHVALLKLTGYATGFTSRRPITGLERILDDYHHGLLRGRTAGINFFVVHLSPHSVEMRCREAAQITALARPLLDRGDPLIILGDFNDISPLDTDHYAALDAEKRRRALAAQQPPPDLKPRNFDVLATFLKAGLVDLVRQCRPGPRPPLSCATMLGKPPGTPRDVDFFGRRIDYILASPTLAGRCLAANVLNEPALDLLSDHYPVLVDLDWTPA